MAYVLPDTILSGTAYTTAASITGIYGGRGGRFFVTNGSVFVQLQYARFGQEEWSIEQKAPPGPGTIDPGAIGIQFRNVDGTVPATVSATIQPPNIPGIQLGSSGVSTPASSSVVTGVIPAAGTTPTAGTGFTYAHVNGSGVYTFTFVTAFAAAPLVLVTLNNTTNVAGGAIPRVTGLATTGFTVTIYQTTPAVIDEPFSFTAQAVV